MNTNNYLPFDLETALKHPERVVTRDGRKVSEFHYFKTLKHEEEQIKAIIDGNCKSYYANGLYCNDGSKRSYDLFLLPEVKECWVNVYEESFGVCTPLYFYKSKEEAIERKVSQYIYIKTIRITNEPE